MKALPSIAFNDFSGSAKDVTTRSTSGGTILTVRSYPSRVYSPGQKVQRNNLSKISRAYKQLTDFQMQSWEILAKHLKGISTFGKAAELPAHQKSGSRHRFRQSSRTRRTRPTEEIAIRSDDTLQHFRAYFSQTSRVAERGGAV